MGNFFAKSTVKDIVNDPEIMEPLTSSASSAVKNVVTDPKVISAAKEIITDPKITSAIHSFRDDIVGELQLARGQVIDQMQLARGELVDHMKVAIDQMKFARRDATIYFVVGSVLAVGVAVGFYIFRSTPPPPAPTLLLPPPIDLEGLQGPPNDGLRTILFRVDPMSFREVRFGAVV